MLESIGNWIQNGFGIFDGLDLTVLYSWLPSDIQFVISVCIDFLLFLALFYIIRNVLSLFH